MKFNYIILSLLVLSPILIQYSDAYLTIPPTRAFSMINGTGGNVTANSYADFIELKNGTGVTISFDYTLHEIMINASSSAISSIHNIGNVTSIGCAVGQILSVDVTGIWVCTTSSASGEANTASSSGVGESFVLPKAGVDLPFKGLAVSGDLSISSNATDVIISHTAGGTGNATNLNDLGDVILVSPAYPSVLFFDDGANNWINRVFSINNQSAVNGHFITGINNQTGIITTQTFRSDSTTCGVGSFFNIFDNQTGIFTCTTFSGVNSLNFTTSSDFDFNFGGNGSALTLDGSVFNFRLKNNIVLTNESAQTITKSLTLNTGVLGGQFNIAGNTFLNTGVLTFPTTTGTILNNIAVTNTANTTSIIADNSTVAGRTVFKTISPGTGISLTNNANDIVIASSSVDTDTTVVSNISNSNATMIADNSTSTNNVRLKNISAGSGIQIDNGTNSLIIINTASAGSGFTNLASTSTSTNATIIAENATSPSTRAVFKTISAGAGIQIDNGSQSVIITALPGSGGIPFSLKNNVTTVTANSWTTVFTIPMTSSSGNSISGILIGATNLATNGIQFATNFTNTNHRGSCNFYSPLTLTTQSIDILNASGVVGTSPINGNSGTGETASLWAYNATSYEFNCGIYSTGTGSLVIGVKNEIAANTNITAGSYYLKTP